QQRPTSYNLVVTNQAPFTSYLQGAEKMEAHTYAHYERLIGKWILSAETDIPGPFEPLDFDLFLCFLQSKITTTTTFSNYNLLRFYEQLIAKECHWIETYARPWELMSSIQAMITAGKERDRILASLSIACMRTGGALTVTASDGYSTGGHGGGAYAGAPGLNGYRARGFGKGRDGRAKGNN
ncbi:hypothetical protein BGZ47_003125, partial [Haplosporangium gracile]